MNKKYTLILLLLPFNVLWGMNPIDKSDELLKAIKTCDDTTVTRLVESENVSPNCTDAFGISPLHYAVLRKSEEIAAILLKHGASAHAKDKSGQTPLHWAAFRQNPLILEALINANADINAQDTLGFTPMHISAREAIVPNTRIFLRKQADVLLRTKYSRKNIEEIIKSIQDFEERQHMIALWNKYYDTKSLKKRKPFNRRKHYTKRQRTHQNSKP